MLPGAKRWLLIAKHFNGAALPAQRKDTTHDYALLFHEGDERGFDHFFQELYPALCLFGTRIIGCAETAKELASDAFIKTWGKHHRLNSTKGITAYLYRVMRNDCYKWLARHSKTTHFPDELQISIADSNSGLERSMIEAEVLRQLYSKWQQLPSARKEVMTKLYIEGKSIQETAAELGLSCSTIKTQKTRAIVFLKANVFLDY